jgi:NTE family protein
MTRKWWVMVWLFMAAMTMQAQQPKIGLVFGGGGAKGAAEIGVLKVLEEVGIRPDYIAGTSIGSIVGGLYAVGYRSAQLDSLFRSQEWLTLLTDRNNELKNEPLAQEDGVTYIFGFPISRKKKTSNEPGLIGALNGDQISELLERKTGITGEVDFDSLPIPFRCVTVDINGPTEVVMSKGNLARALRASMAIPGVFKPVRWDGMTLVDGGMMNNLPVDVVRAMGADIVIAIDLSREEHKDRNFSLEEVFGIGGLLDWAVSRPDWKKYNANRKDADVLIQPNLDGYGVESFGAKSVAQMIASGEKAARQKIKELERIKR